MFRKLFFVLLLMFLAPVVNQACELKFSIVGEKKASYKAGDELIVEVTVVYTHRVCEIALSDTKFAYEGVKILGAKPWQEVSPTTFTRQIKIVVLDDDKPEGKLTLTRKCNKEGAMGSFKIVKTKG